MSRYLIIFGCLLFCLMANGQNKQQDMNDIKKSRRYVYAVAASANGKEEATQRAKDLLLLEVEQWLKEEKKDNFEGYVVKVKNNTSQIETHRGKLYRVFVYVAKKDILPYYKDEKVETVSTVKDNTDPQGSDTTAQNVVTPKAHAVTLTVAEERMVKIDRFSELNAYISEQKECGTISDCGKYSTMPKDSDIYVFVYNQQGEICAVIKRFGSESLNMRTLQKDDVTRYKNCGAIWIKMKE